jgi:hypothetical protein
MNSHRLNTLAQQFGAKFVNESATKPSRRCSILESRAQIEIEFLKKDVS